MTSPTPTPDPRPLPTPAAAPRPSRTVLSAYRSPLGPMTLAVALGAGLPAGGAVAGAWFDGQRHDRAGLPAGAGAGSPSTEPEPATLAETRAWLDACLAGEDPGPLPPLLPAPTPFQELVRLEMLQIPRGQVRTYQEIADAVAIRTGHRAAARAVGGAVARNRVCVLVPCHRVVGADGSLTGYAGGLARKTWLLHLEGAHLRAAGVEVADQARLPGM